MAIVGANEIYKKLSSQIESQFPGFIREEGPQFVAFLKAYFEYMEQSGKAGSAIRSIQDNQDVDRTLSEFVEYFRREFMVNIPQNVLADKRLLVKHIREFYRARGSQESFRFLFRALYNEEIDFYYPGDDILRASDGRWLQEVNLRVSAPFNIDPHMFGGKKITGLSSKATAIVRSVSSTIASGVTVYDLSIENVSGTFSDNERIIDENNKFATVNADFGSLTDITIYEGGAFHESGDVVEIGGASSTEVARGIVTKTSDRSAVTIKLINGGSGYLKDSTRLLISGGSGQGLQAKVESFTLLNISEVINNDIIKPMKDVPLNAPSFFVRSGANTGPVGSKLTGTVKLSTGSNNVIGQGTSFTTQLQVGDIVRVTGQANTLRVHSITGAQTFVSAFRPASNQVTGANAYIKLAAANVTSTLTTALSFSNSASYSVNAITLIRPGWGYSSLPTITIIDDDIGSRFIDDGNGGYLGRNAIVTSNNAYGSIEKIKLTSVGSNFSRSELAYVLNTTKSNNAIVVSNIGQSNVVKYLHKKKTYFAQAFPITKGQRTLDGRYIDTKGFLSWNNKLQDNFYYQEFSYVVRVAQLLDKYKKIVDAILHPAGTKMFADYRISATTNMPPLFGLSLSNFQTLNQAESITVSDTVASTLKTFASIAELSGSDIIDPYQSTLISVYASTLIGDIGGIGTLKLEDSIDATIT